MPEIALHGLRVDRRALLGWSIGVLLTVLMYLIFFPSIRDNAQAYQDAIEGLPKALQRLSGTASQIGSPAGYLQAQFFASLGFILLAVFTVGRGARAISGDERDGLLELLLAGPTSRTRLVLERALGMAIETTLLGAVVVASVLILGPLFALHVSAAPLIGATASLVAGALVFGYTAFAAGAISHRRGVAVGAGAAVATAGFLYTTLSPLVGSLASSQFLSPAWQAFGYAPIEHGFDVARFAVLAAEAAVLVGLAVWGLRRRDLW